MSKREIHFCHMSRITPPCIILNLLLIRYPNTGPAPMAKWCKAWSPTVHIKSQAGHGDLVSGLA